MFDLHAFLSGAICFFYPRRCAVCDELIPPEDALCETCADALHPITEPFCTKCGNLKRSCECKEWVYHFEGCAAPFCNSGAARECVYGMKFSGRIDTARFLARLMAACARVRFPGVAFDLVCCVPMHPAKQRRLGYNQSDLLARALAKRLGLRYDAKALARVAVGRTQHTLNARDRFDNVKNLYACRRNLRGKTVLLVDDIKTTGATLDECARQLLLAGADAVYCVAALVSE